MSRCEGLAGQVCYPATELIVRRRDEAALFTVKGVTDGEFGVASITMRWEVRGIQTLPQEEGITPLLGPQLCAIHCGRQHCELGPSLFHPSHLTCLLDQAPLQCRRQRRFHPLLPPVPHGQPSSPETSCVMGCPEFGLAPERRDEVSFDYTGRRPVLRSRLNRIHYGQPRLIHRQAGVCPRRKSLRQASEESREKNLLEVLLDWAKCCAHSRGHPLQKCPLLLEGLL